MRPSAIIDRVRATGRRAARRAAPVTNPMARALSPITSMGWTIVVIGAGAWAVGAWLDWEELLILAGGALVILVLSLLMTLGRLALSIDVTVTPVRVEVGGDAVGELTAVNDRGSVSFGTDIEVPVGRGVATFHIGALVRGHSFSDVFVVPTTRRAVVPIGPARSVKGDPLGIARREVTSGGRIHLYVHPRTVALPPFSSGFIRDLEGQTTNDLSTSDVAFHTLREYEIGDDLRHVHWRTSAKMLSANESSNLMVRQFVDTRRSHLGVVLSPDATDWASEDEFELGVSVTGSLGRGGLVNGQDVSAVCGRDPLPARSPQLLLDALSAVEADPDGMPLRELANRSLAFVKGASVVALVVGSAVDRRVVRAACETYRSDVVVLALRCALGEETSRHSIRNVTMVTLGALDDLPRLMGTA